MATMNNLKIGVIGSYRDKHFDEKLIKIAFETGKLIAKNGATLIVGPEPTKELNSGVIGAAAEGAKSAGGLVVGILPRMPTGYEPKYIDVMIFSGGEMGGMREVVLTSSCDAIISICGGAGTLCEIALAYHNRVPVIAMKTTGGASEKYADQYLDYRKELHTPIIGVTTPKEAVQKALKLAKTFRGTNR